MTAQKSDSDDEGLYRTTRGLPVAPGFGAPPARRSVWANANSYPNTSTVAALDAETSRQLDEFFGGNYPDGFSRIEMIILMDRLKNVGVKRY
jgi:hypothetical protein